MLGAICLEQLYLEYVYPRQPQRGRAPREGSSGVICHSILGLAITKMPFVLTLVHIALTHMSQPGLRGRLFRAVLYDRTTMRLRRLSVNARLSRLAPGRFAYAIRRPADPAPPPPDSESRGPCVSDHFALLHAYSPRCISLCIASDS